MTTLRGFYHGLLAVVVGGLLWGPADASAQCAMCRTAFQSPEGRQLLAAFQDGILFLLAAPYLTFGLVVVLAVRARRRTARAVDREGARGHTGPRETDPEGRSMDAVSLGP